MSVSVSTSMSTATAEQKQRDVLDLFAGIGYSPRPKSRTELNYDKPSLREALGPISVGDSFNFFNPEELEEAEKFFKILQDIKTHEEFKELAEDAQKRMNKRMFAFVLSWAIQESSLYRGIYIPPVAEHSPEYFIPYETIVEAVYRYLEEQRPVVIPIHPTGSVEDEEHKVAYFREDIGVNSHHWHWHLVYPYSAKPGSKDRKGELFYYMHHQMLARYDAARLSLGLKPVVPLKEYNFGDVLMGYSSHLSLDHGKRSATRPDGMSLTRVTDLVRWRERIMEAIHNLSVVNDEGQIVSLSGEDGINIMGAIVESSVESPNKRFYGNLHNMLHNELSQVHDVNGKFEELPGVLGDISTAVRDPVFFQLHKFVDGVFTEFKNQFGPYEKEELTFPDVEIANVEVEGPEVNVVTTSMKKGKLGLNYAIHIFPPQNPVEVEYEYLDHSPFSYKIAVKNHSDEGKHATVRIYIAPTFDENKKRLTLEEQRQYFIELDKFEHMLTPGDNNITRRSIDSTVTVRKEQIPSVKKIREMLSTPGQFTPHEDNYCSCGWPHHLLVPRGTTEGMAFSLFVMLTDYNEDCVGLTDVCIDPQGGNPVGQCRGSLSYCGVKNKKYPDKKPMGFPFDRPTPKPPQRCRENPSEDCIEAAFKTPNMSFSDVVIRFMGSA